MYNRITIIKPNMYSSRSKGALQPLFAAALAAYTPDEYEVKLYDDRIEEIPYDEPTDIVAISIETFCAIRSYKISGEYRKRGVKIVAGGYHPTLVPEECLDYVDAVVIGDAEGIWPLVLNDLKNNRLKKFYKQDSQHEDGIRYNRKIFKNKSYSPIEMVQWGRGCPHNCEFCSIKSFYKSEQRCRPVKHIVEEISNLGEKTIFFVDDNLLYERSRFVALLNDIKPLNIRWIGQISINVAQDMELLKLMAESGCVIALIGIESFSVSNLILMKKQWNNSKLGYDEAIKRIMSFGIQIYGTFIFGYDYDTPDSFKYAVDFAMKHNFFIANFNPLYPFPGSRLYDRYLGEKRLSQVKWWLDESFYYGKPMFEPAGMTSSELEINCHKAKLEFNSWKSILLRGSALFKSNNTLQNLSLFFWANYINRKEIISKHGKILGR